MQMFRAKCAGCDWSFDVVVLPMDLTLAADLMMQSNCPMCGNCEANTVAPARELTDEERSHKAALEAQRQEAAE